MPAVNLCPECMSARMAEPRAEDVWWAQDVPTPSRWDLEDESFVVIAGDFLFSFTLRTIAWVPLCLVVSVLLRSCTIGMVAMVLGVCHSWAVSSADEGKRIGAFLNKMWKE